MPRPEELKDRCSRWPGPSFFIPVHGEFPPPSPITPPHRQANSALSDNHVLLCEDGDVVELSDKGIDFGGHRSGRLSSMSTASSVTSDRGVLREP